MKRRRFLCAISFFLACNAFLALYVLQQSSFSSDWFTQFAPLQARFKSTSPRIIEVVRLNDSVLQISYYPHLRQTMYFDSFLPTVGDVFTFQGTTTQTLDIDVCKPPHSRLMVKKSSFEQAVGRNPFSFNVSQYLLSLVPNSCISCPNQADMSLLPRFIQYNSIPRVASHSLRIFLTQWAKASHREFVFADQVWGKDEVSFCPSKDQRNHGVIVSTQPLCTEFQNHINQHGVLHIVVFRDAVDRFLSSFHRLKQSKTRFPLEWKNRTLSELIVHPPNTWTTQRFQFEASLQTRMFCGTRECLDENRVLTTNHWETALTALEGSEVVVDVKDVNSHFFVQLSHALGQEDLPHTILPHVTRFGESYPKHGLRESLTVEALELVSQWTEWDDQLVQRARERQTKLTQEAQACRKVEQEPRATCAMHVKNTPACLAGSKQHLCPGKPLGAPIQFIHIPKAGGTAIFHYLEKWSQANDQAFFRYDSWLTTNCSLAGFHGTFAGHRLWGVCPEFDVKFSPQVFIVVLRDPIQRFVSNFDYIRSYNRDRRTFRKEKQEWKDTELSELILRGNSSTRSRFQTWAWHQTKHLCGYTCKDTDSPSRSDFELAKQHLMQADVVVVMNDLNAFISQFQYHVGRNLPLVSEMPHINRHTGNRSILTPEARTVLEEWSEMDLHLFKIAQARSWALTQRARTCNV